MFAPDPTPSKVLKLVEVCMAGVMDRILDKEKKEMFDKFIISVRWERVLCRKDSVGFMTVQYSTVQYSTVQYSTVQYSIVQYTIVHYSSGDSGAHII